MNVAAIYRVSTDRQLRRDSDDSIPVQKNAVRAFIAQRPGWRLVREYAEEGVSGFKVSAADRDVLQSALQDAKAGHWQALIVFKADRLSRNAFEYPVVIDRFRRLGVEVWSVADAPGGKLLALDTQMDKFVRFLEGWQAETESKNTSIRVSEAMLHLARQGKWSGGPPPYGFKLNEARRPKSEAPALLVDPDQAESIRLMVDLYLEERMGCVQIAKELNRRGVPNTGGRPWDDQRVRRVLQNPIVAGLPAFNRNKASGNSYSRKNPYDLDQFILPRDGQGNLKPVPEYQIVPLERWLALLHAMRHAKTPATSGVVQHYVSARRRGADALLTGLLFCGHCGARLSADASPYRNVLKDGTVRRGRRLFYECQTHTHKGRDFCTGQRSYGQRKLESAVLSQLERLLSMLDPSDLTRLLEERGEVHSQAIARDAELAKADRVVKGWLARMDAYLADPAASPFTEEMLTAKIREARGRREALVDAARPVSPKPQVPVPADWWQAFAGAPPTEQKLLLRDLVERIDVYRDEVEIRFRMGLEAFLPKAAEQAAAQGALPSKGTPFVSGVVALMLDANPNLTVAQMREILRTTAQDWGPAGQDADYGWGRLDAYAAVKQAGGFPGGTTPPTPGHVSFAGRIATSGARAEHSFAVNDTSYPLNVTMLTPTSGSGGPDFEKYGPEHHQKTAGQGNMPGRRLFARMLVSGAGGIKGILHISSAHRTEHGHRQPWQVHLPAGVVPHAEGPVLQVGDGGLFQHLVLLGYQALRHTDHSSFL